MEAKKKGETKVYISGALTGVSNLDLKKFYEDIGAICEEFGMAPYIPHQHTDPERHPDITPRQVYQMDKKQVSESDLVIAYVGVPSWGVAREIEIAQSYKVPLVLLYEKEKQISRMLLGNPKVMHKIAFTDFDDALRQLRRVLEKDFFRLHLTKRVAKKGSKQRILRPRS